MPSEDLAKDIYLTSKEFDNNKLLNLHLLNLQVKKCRENGYFDLNKNDTDILAEKYGEPMESLFKGLADYSANFKNASSSTPPLIIRTPQVTDDDCVTGNVTGGSSPAIKELEESEELEVYSVSSGVYGVNLDFLKNFIKENNISDEMLTWEVVKTIIIPHTQEFEQTYVSKLRECSDTRPQKYFCEFPNERESEHLVDLSSFNHPQTYLTGKTRRNHCYFLSHTWNMPFHHLVSIAETKMRVHFTGYCCVPDLVQFRDISYFWIDIFCKNQHVPAPAMDEFQVLVYYIHTYIYISLYVSLYLAVYY